MNRLWVCSLMAACFLRAERQKRASVRKQSTKGNMRSFPLQALVLVLVSTFMGRNVSAATIFESGTLGATGVTWSELENQTVLGTNVNSAVLTGVRFELTQPAITSQVGGHFAGPTPGTFFGAIVKLDDANNFPDFSDLSTPDVLGATMLTFSNPSAEVFGNLNISLDPGWYALVFGSGLFGTTGYGAAVRNGADIDSPSYVAFNANLGWFNLDTFQDPVKNHRFVVTGSFVPEPNTLNTILCLIAFVVSRRRR